MIDKDKLRPPWTKTGKKIESAIRKALYDFSMVAPTITLALSGGKDSLTLLLMLKAIQNRGFSFTLNAIHIKGATSCGPGLQLQRIMAVCDLLEVPLTVIDGGPLSYTNCYSCSRNRRKLLFEGTLSLGSDTLAMGHHRDDHAETLMLNMLHKGEFAGLLPKLTMHDFGVTIIRPLIYVTEQAIRHFAQYCGFATVLCNCPIGAASMRYKVKQMLHQLEPLFPYGIQNIAHAGLVYGSNKAQRNLHE